MKMGKIKKIVNRPDVIPVTIPEPKPEEITIGIPAPDWPTRKPDEADKPEQPSKEGGQHASFSL